MSSEELYLLAVDKEDDNICIATSDYRNTDVKKVNIIYGTTAKFVYNAIRGIKNLKETKEELKKKKKEKKMIKVKTDGTNVGIKWRDYSKQKPVKEGWYLTVELPKYYDLERGDIRILTKWTKELGVNKYRYMREHFLDKDGNSMNEQIIFWAPLPEIPDLTYLKESIKERSL